MTNFANWLFTVFLSWTKVLMRGLWDFFTADQSGLSGVFRAVWLPFLVVLLLAGTFFDYVVWFVRWRPHYVWRSKLMRRRWREKEREDVRALNQQDMAPQYLEELSSWVEQPDSPVLPPEPAWEATAEHAHDMWQEPLAEPVAWQPEETWAEPMPAQPYETWQQAPGAEQTPYYDQPTPLGYEQEQPPVYPDVAPYDMAPQPQWAPAPDNNVFYPEQAAEQAAWMPDQQAYPLPDFAPVDPWPLSPEEPEEEAAPRRRRRSEMRQREPAHKRVTGYWEQIKSQLSAQADNDAALEGLPPPVKDAFHQPIYPSGYRYDDRQGPLPPSGDDDGQP